MSSYPTYRSPVRLLQELGLNTNELDLENLNHERKRLLLELQLAEDQTIRVENKSFTKNDIIQLFDELKGITNLDFHCAIYNHPELLNFLENRTIKKRIKNLNLVFEQIPNKRDEFAQFISPYLASAIDKLLIEVIPERKFIDVEKAQVLFKLLTPTDVLFAFKKFNVFCQELDETLKGIIKGAAITKEGEAIFRDGGSIFPRGHTLFLHYRPFYGLTNYVNEYFVGTADTVARAIITFTVECRNGLGRRDSLVKISDQARALHCSHDLDQILLKNREQFEKSAEEILSGGSSGSPGMSGKGVLQIIMFIILGLVFLFRSCGNGETVHSSANDDILRRIEEIRQQRGISNQSTRKPLGSKFTQAGFVDLHRRVNNLVNNGIFAQNSGYPIATPCVLSRYMKHSDGEYFTIHNQTNSDMLLFVWSGPSLYSYFLKEQSSTEFTALTSGQLFMYSGNDWQKEECIQANIDALTPITISGRFNNTSEKDLGLLRKRFILSNDNTQDFTVKEVGSNYELYQGDGLVLYRY